MVSSPGDAANFTEEELGQQLLDVVLEPGDLLYFPRGFTHQVITALHVHYVTRARTAYPFVASSHNYQSCYQLISVHVSTFKSYLHVCSYINRHIDQLRRF